MKRPVLFLFGGLLLVGCSNSALTGGSTRPDLPTGIEVRFPAQAGAAYLSLLTEDGQSVYQVPVAAGQTTVAVDSTKWAAQSVNARPIETFIAEGAVAAVSPAGVKVNLLHWVLWQDRNSDGQLQAGEDLPLMTHDRVAYASAAVQLEFTAGGMHQRWNLAQGWSRAEHYVYLPTGSDTYERLFTTNGLQRYELHEPTPPTSK